MSEVDTNPAAAPELTFSGTPTTATAEAPVAEAAPVRRRGKLDKNGVAIGTGRRKTAVARVRLKKGAGKFEINGRPMTEFFRLERDQQSVQSPLKLTETLGTLDVWVRV